MYKLALERNEVFSIHGKVTALCGLQNFITHNSGLYRQPIYLVANPQLWRKTQITSGRSACSVRKRKLNRQNFD